MKKFVFAIFMLVQFLLGQIYGQKFTDRVFNVEVRESVSSGTYINYSDRDRDKYRTSPKFTSNERSARDNVNFRFNLISKKDSIERTLFKAEELDTLKRGIAICQIHIPSGKIVSVSFALQNYVDINKLKRFKNEIETNLYLEVELYGNLEKEGYLLQSFPIFVSRRRK
ncbi:hypothetical protein [Limibacterium fermenti]|uniref:hypothetical protein n=1 Tax=Limibacterium fermenti TaxID=3229863 RepID=UPI003A75F37B